MAVTNSSDQSRFVRVVDFGRIDVSDVLLRDLPALCNGIVAPIARNESVHDGVADLESLMLFPGVFGKLSGSISDDPEVDIQSSRFQVDGHDISFLQLEVSVWTRGLNAVASRSISEHAVASHFDVEDMLLAITEGLGENPLDTLASSSKTL
jgi:hypothetical protein